MKAVGIIAEYNPFHNGHAWQIEEARRRSGADHVVVIMSPDFVQRGEPALVNSYTRAAMALAGGADLVLSLPVGIATGSAGQFGTGAVSILDSLGCISHLSFGVESSEPELFHAAASVLAREPAAYRDILLKRLAAGDSYPAARETALLHMLSSSTASGDPGGKDAFSVQADRIHALCSSPNNILGLEYMTALRKLGSTIQPLPVLRSGTSYHEQSLPGDGTHASAAAIRTHVFHAKEINAAELAAHMGREQITLLEDALAPRRTPDSIYRRYSSLLQYCLWEHAGQLEDYLDITEDLANRIRAAAFSGILDSADLTDVVKTRQLTASRVRRALLHVFLAIPSETASLAVSREAGYARILGFRKSAAPLLHTLKTATSIPLISKNADAGHILGSSAMKLFQQDMRAEELYAFLEQRRDFSGIGLRRSPIRL